MGGADISDGVSVPAFILYQIIIEQYKDIIGMKEIALIVDDTDSVGIAICGNAAEFLP